MRLATPPFPYRATLFWDVPEQNIDWRLHERWVIERVLSFGTIEEVLAVCGSYGQDSVAQVLHSKESIPERRRLFWEAHLRERGESAMHPEVLTPEARSVLAALAPTARRYGFVLVGGTATALHLGHRDSHDLDFFTEAHFDVLALQDAVREAAGSVADIMPSPDTLHLNANNVRLSFIRQSGMRLSASSELDGMPVADEKTLLALKLNAIAGRGDRKDFIDVFGLCQAGVGGPNLLQFAEKYLPMLDQTHLLVSLSYVKDAEATPMPHMRVDWQWSEIRRYFERTTSELLQQQMRRDPPDAGPHR